MEIGQILKEQQPTEFENLNKRKCKDLSFSDYREMMKHSSYKRGKGGAIKQLI